MQLVGSSSHMCGTVNIGNSTTAEVVPRTRRAEAGRTVYSNSDHNLLPSFRYPVPYISVRHPR